MGTTPPPISGFTFVRNAVKLDFPVVGSIRSLLPVCEEVVVAVGMGEDDTLGLIRSIGDPRVRVIETEWDLSRGRAVLADQTDIAMRACRHPWGIYIQADEVLADGAAERLRDAIHAADRDARVEGILVRYLHFYGGFDTLATHRRMYRREVRAVRLDPALGIHSFRDAQGFRVGAGERRIRARLSDATMLHYGWARSAEAVKAKQEAHAEIFQWDAKKHRDAAARKGFEWHPLHRHFPGPHPAVVRDWVAEREAEARGAIGPVQWRKKHLRDLASALVEKVSGWRPFEFRNYTLV
jgi:hypothetical protein